MVLGIKVFAIVACFLLFCVALGFIGKKCSD